jgi:enterochelin esterase-like enzyme
MKTIDLEVLVIEQVKLDSKSMQREMLLDLYIPKNLEQLSNVHLLLINDGQDLITMNFAAMLDGMIATGLLQPLFCVGIHAGVERRQEYGTAKILDFQSRGSKTEAYNNFILTELIPFIRSQYYPSEFQTMNLAGFSLGGLTAIDMVWHYPDLFSTVGVFSGSLWWRSKDLHNGYNEDTDRIMHRQVRNGKYHAGLRFYFTTGSLDEVADRNGNGIIDSIDDTLSLIEELKKKGYDDKEIKYINFVDGKHDVKTWGRAMPAFLMWGWGEDSDDNLWSPQAESC